MRREEWWRRDWSEPMPNEKVNSERYVDGYDEIFGGVAAKRELVRRRTARSAKARRAAADEAAQSRARRKKARLDGPGSPGASGRSLKGGSRIAVEALAVHPLDAAGAQHEATKAGIDVIVDPTGALHFGSVRDYDRYAKLRGYFNKDGQTPRG